MTKVCDVLAFWRERILLWLVLVVPVVLIERFTPMQWTDLRFQREQILAGEWWRIFTGHIDHLGWNHLALNGVFLAVCLSIFSPLHRFVNTFHVWLIASVLISVCMLIMSPNLVWYVGLSSSLYALLIYGIAMDDRFSMMMRAGIAGLVIGKVWLEQGSGQNWVEGFIAGPVSELSHLYGVMVGVTIVCFVLAYNRLIREA